AEPSASRTGWSLSPPPSQVPPATNPRQVVSRLGEASSPGSRGRPAVTRCWSRITSRTTTSQNEMPVVAGVEAEPDGSAAGAAGNPGPAGSSSELMTTGGGWMHDDSRVGSSIPLCAPAASVVNARYRPSAENAGDC